MLSVGGQTSEGAAGGAAAAQWMLLALARWAGARPPRRRGVSGVLRTPDRALCALTPGWARPPGRCASRPRAVRARPVFHPRRARCAVYRRPPGTRTPLRAARSEGHTSELPSRENVVCRLL